MEYKTKSTSKLNLVPSPRLRTCLNRFYTLDENRDYEEFLIELGAVKHVRVSAMNSKPTVMLCIQNKSYVLNTMYPEGKAVRVRFKPGEKAYRRKQGGELIPTMFQLLDNILVENLTVEGFDITIERVFTKTQLLITMEMKDVTCFRRFCIPTSKHTIDTETSRRSSIVSSSDMSFQKEEESFTDYEFDGESKLSEELQICD